MSCEIIQIDEQMWRMEEEVIRFFRMPLKKYDAGAAIFLLDADFH